MKKLIALLLVAVMVVSIVPLAMAVDIPGHEGHELSFVAGKPATCTKSGLSDGYFCITCGGFAVNQKYIPAGHQYVDDVCTGCGDVIEREVCDGTNHPNMEKSVVAPTCYKEGYTLYSCPDCGESFKHDVVAALNHPNMETIVVEATCYVGGYTKYYCPDCNESFIHDETAALNHPNMEKSVVAPTCYKEGYTLDRKSVV